MNIECDHIRSRSRFPHLKLRKDNMQILCHFCNVKKGSIDMTDYRPTRWKLYYYLYPLFWPTILATIVFLLTGCGSSSEPIKVDSVIVGDSKCFSVEGDENKYRYANLLGVKFKCVPGLKLIDVAQLPEKTILALGVNDALEQVDLALFTAHLSHLMHSGVVCVLPEWNALVDVTLYRDAMLDSCPRVINSNIIANAPDGLHFDRANHREMADILKPLI